MKDSFTKYPVGDSCICWSFGDEIDKELNRKVLFFYRKLKTSDLCDKLGIVDLVPSYKALAVHFDLYKGDYNAIDREVGAFLKELNENYTSDQGASAGNVVEIPVVYDGEDLSRVAELNKLTEAEVIKLHTAPEYQVALVGFRPYFPYLIGLDEKLVTPRLDNPRTSIPAGSVAIGGAQTGVYPEASPGGWNIIGKTDPELLKQVSPGDTLKFKECKEL